MVCLNANAHKIAAFRTLSESRVALVLALFTDELRLFVRGWYVDSEQNSNHSLFLTLAGSCRGSRRGRRRRAATHERS
jgi:hypothetical protein